MNINENAPVTAAGVIDVAANQETIWRMLSAIDRWPDWNPDIKEAALQGELAVGSMFSWKTGPLTINSTILELQSPHTIVWKGMTLGITAIHVWRLEPGDRKTRVMTEESWEGLLPLILTGPMKRMLQRSIDTGLMHLKKEAQRRATHEKF